MSLLLLALPLLGAALASAGAPFALPDGTLLQELQRLAQAGQAARGPAVGPLDAVIDFLLAGAVPQIVSKGRPSLPLQDFSFHFNTSVEGLRLQGGVDAGGGSLENMTSLYRKGAAVVRRAAGGTLLLEAAAGVRQLRLTYRKYTASFDGPLAKGELQVDVSPVAVRAQLALVPPCAVRLQQLQVAEMGPIRLQVTGLPPWLSGLPHLLESLLEHPELRQQLENVVAAHVAAMVAPVVKGFSCKK